MADSNENYEDLIPEDTPGDVQMSGDGQPVVEILAAGTADEVENGDNNGLPFQEENMDDVVARVTYIDYLKSPVIGLLVGQGDEQALLTAHQALLVQSPWFADACAKFSDEVSVCSLHILLLVFGSGIGQLLIKAVGATNRPRRRRPRRRRLLPRIPLHRRLFPQKDSWHTRSRARPFHTPRRRNR